MPDPPRLTYEQLPPAGWPSYSTWRPVPAFETGMMPLLSKRLSQPLTVLHALQQLFEPAAGANSTAGASGSGAGAEAGSLSAEEAAAVAAATAEPIIKPHKKQQAPPKAADAKPAQAAATDSSSGAGGGVGLSLRKIEELCVHVVGASAFEVPADPVWEELMHL